MDLTEATLSSFNWQKVQIEDGAHIDFGLVVFSGGTVVTRAGEDLTELSDSLVERLGFAEHDPPPVA